MLRRVFVNNVGDDSISTKLRWRWLKKIRYKTCKLETSVAALSSSSSSSSPASSFSAPSFSSSSSPSLSSSSSSSSLSSSSSSSSLSSSSSSSSLSSSSSSSTLSSSLSSSSSSLFSRFYEFRVIKLLLQSLCNHVAVVSQKPMDCTLCSIMIAPSLPLYGHIKPFLLTA